MARISRVVIPDLPHHITQRGNRRQQTFFSDEDYQYYLDLLAEWSNHFKVSIWAYCLMPNHIHIITVPKFADGLAKVMEQVHSRYTRYMNFQKGWKGPNSGDSHLTARRFPLLVSLAPVSAV